MHVHSSRSHYICTPLSKLKSSGLVGCARKISAVFNVDRLKLKWFQVTPRPTLIYYLKMLLIMRPTLGIAIDIPCKVGDTGDDLMDMIFCTRIYSISKILSREQVHSNHWIYERTISNKLDH